MEGRKRAKTNGQVVQPGQVELQAMEHLIQQLSSCLTDQEAGTIDGAQLDSLIKDLLDMQRRLQGSPAESVLDQAVQDVLQQLQDTAEALQAVVDKYTPPDGYRPPVAGSEQYVRDVITYAHKLCYTTFAPPGFVPGQTALRHFKPPAPQDLQLRSSQLHQFQREYEARQAQAKEAAAAAAAAAARAPAPKQAADAPEAAVAAAGAEAAPASLEDLLKDLPPMPPGWKPGDPIPTADGGAAPAKAAEASSEEEEEEEAEEAVAAMQRPQLVSAFNLALNPGLEMEFGGGSSDDDDSEEDSD